jgi:hypothetical protein
VGPQPAAAGGAAGDGGAHGGGRVVGGGSGWGHGRWRRAWRQAGLWPAAAGGATSLAQLLAGAAARR